LRVPARRPYLGDPFGSPESTFIRGIKVNRQANEALFAEIAAEEDAREAEEAARVAGRERRAEEDGAEE
jgi:hypothetical protein